MGLWQKRTGARQVEDLGEQVAGLKKRLDTLSSLMMDISNRLGDLERPVRELQLEWEDNFEKFRNLYGRITKRIKREEEEAEEPPAVAALSAGGVPADINPAAARILSRGIG